MTEICSWSNNKKPCHEIFTYWREDLNRYLCAKHYRKAKNLEKSMRGTINKAIKIIKCENDLNG